jgi:tyrosinase
MGVRKNQSKLTASERNLFVKAMLAIKRRGDYDDLVRIHTDRMTSDWDTGQPVGHIGPSFLPWHREYLIRLEQALQSIDPRVTIPYWNWTVDRGRTSSPWTGSLLGGDGRPGDAQVTTGPFAYSTGNWTLNVRLDDRPYLTRAMGQSTPTLPTGSDLSAVLARTPYDASPWDTTPAGSFRNGVEGFSAAAHNQVHVWVGGHMLTSVSPNDPVFWMHHCFIDKCWADWCAAHPGLPYLPGGDTANVVDVNETMPPWNDMTPASLIDHTRFYTYA